MTFVPLYVKRYAVTSHAARSRAPKLLLILMSAVVTIVPSMADTKSEIHSLHESADTSSFNMHKRSNPASMTCSLLVVRIRVSATASERVVVGPSPSSIWPVSSSDEVISTYRNVNKANRDRQKRRHVVSYRSTHDMCSVPYMAV